MELLINFFTAWQDFRDVGLFLMRLLVAFVFAVAVKNKLKDVTKFAKTNELPMPVAWILAFAEGMGALGLALGILTPLAALIVMGVMLGSMSFHIFKWQSPYWAAEGGWEYDLMLFTMAFVILVTGGGNIALYPLV